MAKRPSSPSDEARTEATAEQGFEREDIKKALETKRTVAPPETEPADAPVPGKRDDREIRIANRKISLKPAKLGRRILDVLPDLPDIRDRIYSPSLQALPDSIYPSIAFPIRDQGPSSSCTGFALAHVIDVLTHRETLATRPVRVSARLLYEMAKRNDVYGPLPVCKAKIERNGRHGACGRVSGLFTRAARPQALMVFADRRPDKWTSSSGSHRFIGLDRTRILTGCHHIRLPSQASTDHRNSAGAVMLQIVSQPLVCGTPHHASALPIRRVLSCARLRQR